MADDRFRWHHEVEDVDTIKGMMAISTSLYPDKAAYKVKEKKGAPYKEITYTQFKEDVDGLGTYFELEIICEEGSEDKARARLDKMLGELAFASPAIEPKTYLELILLIKQ